MTDPTKLTRRELSKLLLMRNAGLGTTALVGMFMTAYRMGAGSWPLTGNAGERDVTLTLSTTTWFVVGMILVGAAYALRSKPRALPVAVLMLAAFVGLLAFAQWIGVGLVVQFVWLLVAVSIGCGILGVWAARRVWYARRPKRWHRYQARIAERDARKEAARVAEDVTVVEPVTYVPPIPRRSVAPVVIDAEVLDAIDLSDETDEPAGQQGR